MKIRRLAFASFILLFSCGIIWAQEANQDSSAKSMLETIKKYVPEVSEAVIDPKAPQALFGRSSHDAGLAGTELYLFPDKTYYYLEWADILPLTIYDKGTWSLKDGFLEFASDKDITWKQSNRGAEQRRYLPMRYLKNGKETLLLMGMEWNFPYFSEQVIKNKKLTELTWIVDAYKFSMFAGPYNTPFLISLLQVLFLPEVEDHEFHLDINTLHKKQDLEGDFWWWNAGNEKSDSKETKLGPHDYEKMKEKLFKKCWRPEIFQESPAEKK